MFYPKEVDGLTKINITNKLGNIYSCEVKMEFL